MLFFLLAHIDLFWVNLNADCLSEVGGVRVFVGVGDTRVKRALEFDLRQSAVALRTTGMGADVRLAEFLDSQNTKGLVYTTWTFLLSPLAPLVANLNPIGSTLHSKGRILCVALTHNLVGAVLGIAFEGKDALELPALVCCLAYLDLVGALERCIVLRRSAVWGLLAFAGREGGCDLSACCLWRGREPLLVLPH